MKSVIGIVLMFLGGITLFSMIALFISGDKGFLNMAVFAAVGGLVIVAVDSLLS